MPTLRRKGGPPRSKYHSCGRNYCWIFLADSGSDCSLLPLQYAGPAGAAGLTKTNLRLTAANGTEIKSIGTRPLSFTLNTLNKPFTWEFHVANVEQPILGTDFLKHHHLLIDCFNNSLIEGKSPLNTSVNAVTTDNTGTLDKLLTNFSDLFQPLSINDKVTHPIEHNIINNRSSSLR